MAGAVAKQGNLPLGSTQGSRMKVYAVPLVPILMVTMPGSTFPVAMARATFVDQRRVRGFHRAIPHTSPGSITFTPPVRYQLT